MSKRSSLNAKRFAGKNWKLSKSKTSSTNPDSIGEKKKNARIARKEAKEKRIQSQFESLCKKFNLTNIDYNDENFKIIKNKFCRIKQSKKRIKALQGVKSFKIYCKKYNENFSLETYFNKQYYLTDFKKEFPDIYFFNVYSQKK